MQPITLCVTVQDYESEDTAVADALHNALTAAGFTCLGWADVDRVDWSGVVGNLSRIDFGLLCQFATRVTISHKVGAPTPADESPSDA